MGVWAPCLGANSWWGLREGGEMEASLWPLPPWGARRGAALEQLLCASS